MIPAPWRRNAIRSAAATASVGALALAVCATSALSREAQVQPDARGLNRGSPALAPDGTAPPRPAFVPGELLVRFEPGVRAAAAAGVRAEEGLTVAEELPMPGLQLVELPPDVTVQEAAARLERAPAVRYAEPNFRHTRSAVPNDPRFGLLWGLQNTGQVVRGTVGAPGADVRAVSAWDVQRGRRVVRVAVADDGVALAHPDLGANVLTNLDRDFVDGDANASPPGSTDFHGTHVAGVVGAVGDNARGVTGVSQRVGLVPLRIFDIFGETTSERIVRAYEYARRRGIDILNASFGSRLFSKAQRDAIRRANGTLFVAAAGNFGSNNDRRRDFPCSYPMRNIVCVAATDQRDRLASFSNFGPTSVDLAAPGTNVLSTLPARKFVADMDEGFEEPLATRWARGGPGISWGRERVSGDLNLTDSPGGRYENNTNSFAQSFPLDLRDRRRCGLRYEGTVRTEPRNDRFLIEASRNGTAWRTLATYSGRRIVFGFDQLPRAFHGSPAVQVRFRLRTDDSVRADGVHLAFAILECETTRATYGLLDGTSFAAPHVAGAAALVKAQFPAATPTRVRNRILRSVDARPGLAGRVATGGRLNVERALLP